MSFVYLATRVERRGNQHCGWTARAGCSGSARTRRPFPGHSSCRRAKEAPTYAQRKKFMCHGVHSVLCRATNSFHEVFIFCLSGTAWAQTPLTLCAEAKPVSFTYLAIRVERRGNQHSGSCSRASHRRKARTRRPWTAHPSSRRAKEASTCSQCPLKQGGKSLYPLCTEAKPVSFTYLAMRVKRRGNQHWHWSSRAIR